MKFTKKQRNKFYKKALKLYQNPEPDTSNFICCLLDRIVENETNEYIGAITLEIFPEFAKFEPKDAGVGMWWPERDKESRIKALKKCIKETNPKPKKK